MLGLEPGLASELEPVLVIAQPVLQAYSCTGREQHRRVLQAFQRCAQQRIVGGVERGLAVQENQPFLPSAPVVKDKPGSLRRFLLHTILRAMRFRSIQTCLSRSARV